MQNVAAKLNALNKFETWTQKSTQLLIERGQFGFLTIEWNRVQKYLENAKLKVEEARAELYKHLEIV